MSSQKSTASDYIDNLVAEVKKKLPEYLSLHGISLEKNGSFKCINPEGHKNGDRNPSASLSQKTGGGYVWNCFVCHKGGDIYHAAEILEGMGCDPTSFIPTTLYLAEKLGIPIDQSKVPSTNPENVLRTKIYNSIMSFIKDNGNGIECLISGRFGRFYDLTDAEEILKLCPFGSVDNTELMTFLNSTYTHEQLSVVPFYRKDERKLDQDLFSTEVMSFPLVNSYATPVGFCARMTDEKCKELKDKGEKVDKYKNSYGSAQFKKRHPFLLYETQKHIAESKRVILVEGQFDAVTMFIRGHKNVVPLMGSSLSIELMDVLTKRNIYEVIFALDSDSAGLKGLKKGLEVTKLYNVATSVVCLPKGEDPDSFLLANRKEEFDNLLKNRQDAICYILEHDESLNNQDEPKDVRRQNMIQYVCEATSLQSKMHEYSRIVARVLGEEEADIFEDIKNYATGLETRNTEVDRVWSKLVESRYSTFEEKTSILIDAQDVIRRVASRKEEHLLQKSWMDLRSLASGQTKLPTRLLTGIPLIDEHARIECGTFNVLAGWPSNGKSSFMRATMVNMLAQNPNTVFLYVSTDDHPKKTLIDTVALLTDLPKGKIRESLDDNTFTEQPEIRQHLDMLQDILSTRIIILGQEDAGSVSQIRKKVDVIAAQCPGQNICVIVDAMNNLLDVTSPKRGGDQRVGLEYATRELKNMAAASDNISCISLLHLNKIEWHPGMRPTLGKIKGSGFMEYEAKVVLFSYIDMHYNKDTQLIWRAGGKMAPVLELLVAKDKDKEANVLVPLHFEPQVGKIYQPRDDEIKKYIVRMSKGYERDEDSNGEGNF